LANPGPSDAWPATAPKSLISHATELPCAFIAAPRSTTGLNTPRGVLFHKVAVRRPLANSEYPTVAPSELIAYATELTAPFAPPRSLTDPFDCHSVARMN
jgi:hypothetical protein